jgi:hypothetical protein
MQENQVLLRSDHFYIFAGVGPIIEGYVIVAPYTCDRKRGGLKTLSEASSDLWDELLFLEGIIGRFYREVYGIEGALCFEHGRAGTCGVSETPHCYHAHMCCFPGSLPIWQDFTKPIWDDFTIPKRRIHRIGNLQDLGGFVGRNPYLLAFGSTVDPGSNPKSVERESSKIWVVLLDKETDVPRQYLRKLVAHRTGKRDLWDWGAAPENRAMESLCQKFSRWLRDGSGLPVIWSAVGAPQLKFLDGVRASNSHAYDAIASDYREKWKKVAPSMEASAKDFSEFVALSHRSNNGTAGARVLDAGCGHGIYMRLFRRAGFECTGIDQSEKMLAFAAGDLAEEKSLSEPPLPLI